MAHRFHDRDFQIEILSNGSREQIIEWLQWNDSNGIWTDTDSDTEGRPPLNLERAQAWMREILSRELEPTEPPIQS